MTSNSADAAGATRDDVPMIGHTVRRWQAFLNADSDCGPTGLLADNVVFHSPILHRPQHGREVVATYLTAAKQLLSGGSNQHSRYTAALLSDNVAMLEFDTTIDNIYINGVDVINTNPAGQIAVFKVFLRPLQAIELVHDRMHALLMSTKPGD